MVKRKETRIIVRGSLGTMIDMNDVDISEVIQHDGKTLKILIKNKEIKK